MPLTARFASNVYKEADTTDHFSAISKSQGKVGEEEGCNRSPLSSILFLSLRCGSKYFFLHRAIDFVQTEFEIVGALFVFIFDLTFSMLLCYYIYDYCYAYEHLICNLEIISKISRGKFYSTFLIRRTN